MMVVIAYTMGGNNMRFRFADVCEARIDLRDAHFWIIAEGIEIGKTVETFNPRRIGIRIKRAPFGHPDFVLHLMRGKYIQGTYAGLTIVTPEFLDRVEFQA
jgi:hypothetical protein